MNENGGKKIEKTKLVSILCLAIAVIVVYLLLSRITELFAVLRTILSPILLGIFIAYLLNPILVWFDKKFTHMIRNKKFKKESNRRKFVKTFSIGLTFIFGLALIISIFLLIIPEFVDSVLKLVAEMPNYFKEIENWLNGLPQDNIIAQNSKEIIEGVLGTIKTWLTDELPKNISVAINAAITSVTFVFNFFISLIISVYVMNEKEKFIAGSKKILYAVFNRERANDIITTARHGHMIFGQFLSGKIIESSLIGVIYFLCMTIFGMQYALLISVIMGVCNMVPLFGPYIGGVPSVLILLMVNPGMALGFAIMILVLQTIDANVFGPMIIGQKTGLSEFWITFALFFFGGIFGLSGMVLGIPLLAVIFYICRAIINNQLAKKNLPKDEKIYYDSDLLTDNGFSKLSEHEPRRKKVKIPFKRLFSRKNKNNDEPDESDENDNDYDDYGSEDT